MQSVGAARTPRVVPLGASAPLAAAIADALDGEGEAGLVLLTAATGDDVVAAIEHLIRPALIERLPGGVLREATGLAWERTSAGGVLGRLGLPSDPDALAQALHARPTAVLVTEAQDADPESLRALSSAVHRLSGPLLVIVSAVAAAGQNAGAELGVLDELGRAHRRTTYVVDALTLDDVREIAVGLGVQVDEAAARRLWRHTEGSAAAIIEILSAADPPDWAAIDARLPAPGSLRRAVGAALAQCDPDTRAVVEACAVIGRWSSLTELSGVSGVDDLLPALDRAVADRLLVMQPGVLPQVGFPSRLARAATYECVGVLRRQALHLVAARVLARPAESLQHRAMAALVPDAGLASQLVDHARVAAREGNWHESALAWLAAHRLEPDAARADDSLVNAIDALVSDGDLRGAAALSGSLESTRTTAARLGVQGYRHLLLGHRHEAAELLGRAWDLCDPEEGATAAVIAHRRALHALVDWDCAALAHWTDAAAARADASETASLEALTMRGLGLGGLGRLDEALAQYRSVTSAIDEGAQAQRALMGQGWLHLALDRATVATHELALAAPLDDSRGSSRVSLWAHGWLARARLATGDLAGAQLAVDQAVPLLQRTGQKIALPLVHWSGAELAALREDWTTAEQHLAAATSVRADYRLMRMCAALAQSSVAMTRADYPTVVRAFAEFEGDEAFDEPGFWPWQDSYAIALVATGEAAHADQFLRPHEARAAARGHVSAQARLAAARGRLHMVTGDIDAGREAFTRALALLEATPLAHLRNRLRFGYAQSLRRAGKRRDASEEFRTARQGFAAMGAVAYVTRCDQELKAGARTRGDASLTALTPQERAVVDLVVQGLSNAEVAASLFISVKTVQYHLTRVYRRLSIRSRAELTALAAGRPADEQP